MIELLSQVSIIELCFYKAIKSMVPQIRNTWNYLLPQIQEIAGAMEERLLVADDVLARVVAPIPVVATQGDWNLSLKLIRFNHTVSV